MRGNTIHILIPCATIKTNRLTMKTEIGGISKNEVANMQWGEWSAGSSPHKSEIFLCPQSPE